MRINSKIHSLTAQVSVGVLAALYLASHAQANDEEETKLNSDATSITASSLPSSSSLGRAAYADTIGHAASADFATNVGRAANAVNATTADHADHAGAADNATRAALADNALQLGGFGSTHFTNAANFSSGTLDLNRLIGELVDSNQNLLQSVLDTGTYGISVSGNADTATTAGYATTAGQANSCTGGSEGCDSFTYLWKVTAWSEFGPCTGDPAYEWRSRTVYCGRSDKGTDVYADSKCSGTKPASNNKQACETFSWQTSAWSAYGACDGTYQYRSRTVTCVSNTDGSVVADSSCSGTKPSSTSQTSCADSFSWWTSSWGSYGACDGSNQYRYRTVQCRNDRTGSAVSDGYCSGSKPSSSSSISCSDSFSWYVGSWGAYGACNGTYQYRYRTVECRNDRTGSTVSDGYCSGAKPSTSSSTSCSDSFTWVTGAWGAYGACDGSYKYRYRTVTCRNDRTGGTVADGNCSGTKPDTSSRSACSLPSTPGGGSGSWSGTWKWNATYRTTYLGAITNTTMAGKSCTTKGHYYSYSASQGAPGGALLVCAD